MFNKTVFMTLFFFIMLCACGQDKTPIATLEPALLTANDVGRFCGMLVTEHDGPKGQVFLKNTAQPLWFVSARDSLAFSRMPDEQFKVSVIYVSDMGKAESWEQPGDHAWVKAQDAYFVEGSKRPGGMGMAEWVPFSEKIKAEQFISEYGGKIVRIDAIETDALLGEDKT